MALEYYCETNSPYNAHHDFGPSNIRFILEGRHVRFAPDAVADVLRLGKNIKEAGKPDEHGGRRVTHYRNEMICGLCQGSIRRRTRRRAGKK